MILKYIKLLVIYSLVLFSGLLSSIFANQFQVKDIKIEGIKHLSHALIFDNINIELGSETNQNKVIDLINKLYKTEYFDDVEVYREEGNILIIKIHERPIITSIDITGNKVIPTDTIEDALKNINILQGFILKRSDLKNIESEFKKIYESQARYGTEVSIDVEEDEVNNSVKINIEIEEKDQVELQKINFVGNLKISDEELLDLLAIQQFDFWKSLFGGNKYNSLALQGDFGKIKNYYYNLGYLDYSLEDVQLSLDPDRSLLYVTISIDEGEQYTINSIELIGDTIIDRKKAVKIFDIPKGTIYNERTIQSKITSLKYLIGDKGYVFNEIRNINNLNKENRTVDIKIQVTPGNRYFVRKLNFIGNYVTRDDVIRKRSIQQEKAIVSLRRLDLTKDRLLRTGYFSNATYQIKKIKGSQNQVDIDFVLDENNKFANIRLELSHSSLTGSKISLGFTKNNFFGTGKDFSTNLGYTKDRTSFDVSLNEQYWYKDLSLSYYFNLSQVNESTASDSVLTSTYYNRMNLGASIGYITGTYTRASWGANYSYFDVNFADSSTLTQEVSFFTETYGTKFKDYSFVYNWNYNSTDNVWYFATRGFIQNISLSYTPKALSTLGYRILHYNFSGYYALDDDKNYVLEQKLGFSYGQSNDNNKFPYYKYFSGSTSYLRGYSSYGPYATTSEGMLSSAFGGNLRLYHKFQLRLDGLKDKKDSMKYAFFIDSAYLTNTDCIVVNATCDNKVKLKNFNHSAGFAIGWFGAIPVGFSYIYGYIPSNNYVLGDKFSFDIGYIF